MGQTRAVISVRKSSGVPIKASYNTLGLAFHRDYICMVDSVDGVIQSIGARELVQPFDLDTLQRTGRFHENQYDIIDELFVKTGAQNRDVGVAVHGGMVLLKKCPVVLGLDESALHEQLQWEAEQFLSTGLDEFIFEYERLPHPSPSGNPTYLLIFIRKRVIQEIQSLIKGAGLSLKDVDVDVFSDMRTLLTNYDIEHEDRVVLIDIQRRYVMLYFINQGEYFLSHRVSVREGGSAAEFHDVADFIEMLRKELHRLIFGYRMGKGVEDLNHIFLIGNEVVRDVAQELMDAVSVPVEIVNPFRKVSYSEAVSTSEEFIHNPERFTTAVGMALRG